MGNAESYVERAPIRELSGVVRTVWIQQTGPREHVHRHLPSGGVELHFPIGGRPYLLGPLTGAVVEVIPPHTTVVGVRFHPGTAPPLRAALDDLVDQRVQLGDLWTTDRLVDTMGEATTPELALSRLQSRLLHDFRTAARLDGLVAEAARALMPWRPVSVEALATDLNISTSQLRRRFLHSVGTTPKVLQRTLRFQGFLALAQAGRLTVDGMAALALEAGYADQAHLSRECLRLTGQTPTEFLRANLTRCPCDHDHSGSYQPFLARR
jgi:AraC-like DNA-binding protein